MVVKVMEQVKIHEMATYFEGAHGTLVVVKVSWIDCSMATFSSVFIQLQVIKERKI